MVVLLSREEGEVGAAAEGAGGAVRREMHPVGQRLRGIKRRMSFASRFWEQSCLQVV